MRTTLSKEKTNYWYPWFIWFLTSSFLFYKYLLQVSPSIMVNELMQAFSLSGLSMGNLAAFYFYAYLCMQLPVGILLDHFNPRRLLSVAILVCALGAWLFGEATSLWMAELGRLLIGVGGAFSAVGAMKFISMWFPVNRFALVSGLMMTVGMLGAVGGEAPLAYAVSQLGWRQTMTSSALIGLVLALCVWLLIRDRKEDSAQSQPKQTLQSCWQQVRRLVINRQSWLISLYSGMAFAPVSAFAGLWGVPYLMEKYGMGRPMTASLVSFVFIGFACGSPLAGWLSDRIARRKPIMIIGTAFSAVILTYVLYFPALSGTVLGALLFAFGFFSGFFFVSFALMREINSSHHSGTSIGFINMFNALFGALSEPLIGKLLDFGWRGVMKDGVRHFTVQNYHVALSVLPVILVLALLMQLFIRESYCVQRD